MDFEKNFSQTTSPRGINIKELMMRSRIMTDHVLQFDKSIGEHNFMDGWIQLHHKQIFPV